MKTKILTILRESSDYVSGQKLCDELGVSRTAIWKVINQLKASGYEIESVQNKGYKLTTAPEILSESEIQSRLKTNWAAKDLVVKKETGSTNNDCRAYLEEGRGHGLLVVADTQKGGKGRRGRSWSSPPGTTISMSLGLKPDFEPMKASMLTLVMALSVANAIEDVCNISAAIKWPNDIVVNRKKVCGILTEMNAQLDYIENVVIGVGINVSQTEFEEEIKMTATSLSLETKSAVSRVALIQKTMEYFEQHYEVFCQTHDLSTIMVEYNSKLANVNAVVRVLDPKGEWEGMALGINKEGELLVKKEDQTVEAVYAGEVSVRGIYGYV